MTGQELFHALSFVDERYIHEAESARLSGGIPWMKILSLAACLCIVLAGAFGLSNMSMKSAAPEAAAPMAAPEAAPEAAPPMPEEIFTESAAAEPEQPLPFEEEVPSGELQHVPYTRLRVVKVLEDGSFEAIAEATEPMEMDTQVRVIVDPSKVPGADADIYDAIGVVADAQLEIYDGAYDPETNILYVAQVLLIEGE